MPYAHGGLCPLIKRAPHVTEKGYMYWFVLFQGDRTARNVLLAATSFEFQARHGRYLISISFSGIISVANYLLARTKSFARRSCGSLYCISFARSDTAVLNKVRYAHGGLCPRRPMPAYQACTSCY